MLWEDNYLAHYGIKGMRWGVQKRELNAGNSQLRSYGNITQPIQRPAFRVQTSNTPTRSSSLASRAVDNPVSKQERDNKNHDTTGRYGKGNIDLNKRKVVKNDDGSISTERSFSTNIDGKEVLLPTVIDGRVVSEDEAIDHYYKTGEHLGKFNTVQEAEEYAEQLHNRQDWYYNTRKKVKKDLNKILKSLKE